MKTEIFYYSTKNAQELMIELGVDPKKGLDTKSVTDRQGQYGPNKLNLKETTGWHIFWRQFKSAFVYLLIAAMVITLALHEWVDSLMILFFLVINTVLGFFQEYSSEKTAKLLNQYALPRVRVLRNGKIEQITADFLVPGDVVILQTGDKVPADIRLIEVNNITINETVLTGESIPVNKIVGAIAKEPVSYHEAENLAFSGTDVLKGEAVGIVIATGKNTSFGKIAKLVGETKKVSNFEKEISRFSKFILKLVGVTLAVVFAAHLLIGRDNINVFDLIIFMVALTVSVIPETMPLVATFSLSRSAKRLVKKKVIVKRLSAIEDLGGIQVLCSDKTGTLTENSLTITNTYSDDIEQTIWLANLTSSFELQKKIEPFDIALEKGLNKVQQKDIKKAIKISEKSFDPSLRTNSSLVRSGDKIYLITRGAPEMVMDSCSHITKDEQENVALWMSLEGKQGHRVLAVAYKEFEARQKDTINYEKELGKNDFIFSGIISFADPIKKSSFQVVKHAKKLGVRIVIITGDSPEVAGSVANKIGLIDLPEEVITWEKWQRASQAERKQYIKDYSVFARITPEGKFALIEAFNEEYMVGFLGEGINDAPALKISGVSIVVNSASDIAREASDIILLRKDLQVIIEGIKEGRKVFANNIKYIKSTMASNFGNFFAVASASLMIDFLPMLPIQILLLNLLSDMPMISIATDTVEESELKSPRKYQSKDIVIAIILGLVSMIFDFIFFGVFFHYSPEVLRTNWFIGSVLTELVLLFSIRTTTLFYKAKRPSKSIIWLSIMIFILAIGLPYLSISQRIFKFVPPTLNHLGIILSLVFVYFVISEIIKLMYYKRQSNNTDA